MGFRAEMVGNKVSMLTKAIARSFDLDDDGVMEKAVEQGGGNNRVAKDLTPFGEAAVGGEDHRPFLVTSIDELEEEIAAALDDRQIADLVDDQESGSAQVS